MTEQLQSYGGRVGKRRPLTEIVQQLLDRIELAGGEVDDGVDALELELEDKVSAYAVIIRQMQGDAAECRRMASFYSARAETPERAVDKLKERLAVALRQVGVVKLKTPTCTAYFQTSHSVEIYDEQTFIEQHGATDAVRVKHVISKEYLRHALDAGEVYEGARLVPSSSLRLR
jgi:hypothetical protein